ncbi:zf-HC2 domain-containing protein [Porcipelethomonas sp.]|uniref:zf-HC2 domain-containing protein n=1 Tax=Porcipelethomonas sp. TaxID=2981675 RepID=UPI003EF892CD
MSNKIPCSIIKDLLPSYIDEVCSSESSDLIAEHLNECGECDSEYKQMLSGYKNFKNDKSVKKTIIRKVSKKIKKRIMVIAVSSALAVAAVCGIIYISLEVPLIKCKYDDAEFNIEVIEMNTSNHGWYTNDGSTIKMNLDDLIYDFPADKYEMGDNVIKVTGKFEKFARNITFDHEETEYGDTIIITARATIFNNTKIELTDNMPDYDFTDAWGEKDIDCIMYDDGERHILWKK